MTLNERQKNILETIIDDYIETGLPISSLQLIHNHDLGVCSATIRNDMLDLTDNGYLYKSYSSSGRVPTSKGYRFFIEEWQDGKGKSRIENFFEEFNSEDQDDIFSFSNDLLEELSNFSPGLLLNYIFDKDILWERGWENVVLQPEMQDADVLNQFVTLADVTRGKIKELAAKSQLNDIEVFIGQENPIIKSDEFSIITCRSKFPKTKQGCAFVLIGPKRMPYRQNLDLFKSVINFLQKT